MIGDLLALGVLANMEEFEKQIKLLNETLRKERESRECEREEWEKEKVKNEQQKQEMIALWEEESENWREEREMLEEKQKKEIIAKNEEWEKCKAKMTEDWEKQKKDLEAKVLLSQTSNPSIVGAFLELQTLIYFHFLFTLILILFMKSSTAPHRLFSWYLFF